MKKTAAIVLTLLLSLTLFACQTQEPPGSLRHHLSVNFSFAPPSGTPSVPLLDGYTVFEDNEHGVRIQYPNNWTSLDFTNPNASDYLLGDSDMTPSEIESVLAQYVMFLIGIDSTDGFAFSSFYLVCEPETYVTLEMLTSFEFLLAIKMSLQESLGDEELDWIQSPAAQTFGHIEGAYCGFSMPSDPFEISRFQFITIYNEVIYMFGFDSTLPAQDAAAVLRTMLSTIEFF